MNRIPRASRVRRAHRPFLPLSLVAAACLGTPAFAQIATEHAAAPADDTDLLVTRADTIVVTGTKMSDSFGEKSGIPLSRMPQSVQVLDADEIRAADVPSVGDLLRRVPSANPGNSRVARYQSFSLKIRGFAADQMRNGLRQRYYEDVDASALANVARVEVLKGPSSVLYGQSAVGGLLSLITLRPENMFGASAALTVGSDARRVGMLDLTGPLSADGRLNARFTAEVERSGTFVDFQSLDRDNVALAIRWQATPAVTLHTLAEYVERRTLGNPGLPVFGTLLPNGTADLPRERYLGEPALPGLTAKAPLLQLWADIDLGGGWTLTPRYQYQEFVTDFSQVRVRSMQDDRRTLNRNGRLGHEDDSYQIAQLDLQGTWRTGALAHHLLLGAEASHEKSTFLQHALRNVGAIDVLAPVYTYPAVAPDTAFAFQSLSRARGQAVYVQDRIELTPAWQVVAGLRHSRFQHHGAFVDNLSAPPALDDSRTSATTWQLASNLRLNAAWSLFGGVNTGFDTEAVLGARAADGTPFKPERSEQLEAGVRHGAGARRFSAAVFEVRRKDALTTDPANTDFSVQTGEQRVRGVEFEGEARLAAHWTVRGGYAWMRGAVTRSHDGDEDAELGNTPRHTLTLGSAVELPGTGVTLRADAYGASAARLVTGSEVRLPKVALLDLGAHWRRGIWSLDLNVHNVFDRRYVTASGNALSVVPGDPRQLSLRLGVTL